MRKINFLHPVVVFIASLTALGTSLYLYIDSYVKVSESLRDFVERSGIPKGQFEQPETWVMILVLSILVTLIIVGMSLVFIYYQKIIQLYRMQQNFINGFTHELKTPIASIRLFIDTMLKHELSKEKQVEYLSLMKIDTERMQENVELILNLARIEDRSFELNDQEINLKDNFKALIDRQSYLFTNLEINIDIESEDSLILFDKKLLDIVFMNILTNAIRYNEKTKKIINVCFVKKNKVVQLIVVDNGIGLTKENVKNVFKKFYQVGKSVKGSGLGLYMVSQIMKLEKSRAWVTSEGLDKGSSFYLEFPIKETH